MLLLQQRRETRHQTSNLTELQQLTMMKMQPFPIRLQEQKSSEGLPSPTAPFRANLLDYQNFLGFRLQQPAKTRAHAQTDDCTSNKASSDVLVVGCLVV